MTIIHDDNDVADHPQFHHSMQDKILRGLCSSSTSGLMTASSYAMLDGPFRRKIQPALLAPHVIESGVQNSCTVITNNELSVDGVEGNEELVSEDDIEEW